MSSKFVHTISVDHATLQYKLQPGIECEIYDIYVEPEQRRKGIARSMLLQMFEMVKNSDTPKVFLEVSVDNIPAINLYKSLGFNEVGVRKHYYSDANNSDAIIMEYVLLR